MKIKYLTDKAYETLLDNLSIDQEKYLSKECWLPEYFGEKEFFKESRLEIQGITMYMEGDKNASDIVNVRTIFDNLGHLTPQQASNPYLWSYISMVDCWQYTTWRWGKSVEEETATEDIENEEIVSAASGKESKRAVNIKQRYLCHPSRIGLLRNAISRLWWYGYLSYQPGSSSRKYELTELLLSSSDLCQSIVERNFSMNRNICYGILQAIKQINDDPNLDNVGKLSSTGEYEWRGLCKYLNRFGAVTLLDTLSCDEIKELSYNYLLNQRGLK